VRAEIDTILADYGGWYWLNSSPSQNLVPPVHERLEAIAVPTLVVDGGRDHPYNKAIADTLVTRIPHTTLLRLPHAGHMASMEDPMTVTQALADLAITAR
jgi:pimeloyl-ACP methyl ester carboxylesterase